MKKINEIENLVEWKLEHVQQSISKIKHLMEQSRQENDLAVYLNIIKNFQKLEKAWEELYSFAKGIDYQMNNKTAKVYDEWIDSFFGEV